MELNKDTKEAFKTWLEAKAKLDRAAEGLEEAIRVMEAASAIEMKAWTECRSLVQN